MKKLIIILFLLGFAAPSFAATVGSPDIDLPEEAFSTRDYAIHRALAQHESSINIRANAEIEFVIDRELDTSHETTGAEMEGQNYMVKVSTSYKEIFEPYIRIGTSNLKLKWKQNGRNITVDSDPGFMWGMGIKSKLWEFKDQGIKLALDFQYRTMDLDVNSVSLSPATSTQFRIEEFQTSLLASKRYILPIGLRDYYITPYTGLYLTSVEVDVRFDSSFGLEYSTYNADDANPVGLVFGLDVMPSLLSWYLFNFELRLFNETAFTFGGKMKF